MKKLIFLRPWTFSTKEDLQNYIDFLEDCLQHSLNTRYKDFLIWALWMYWVIMTILLSEFF